MRAGSRVAWATGIAAATLIIGGGIAAANHFDNLYPSSNYDGGSSNCQQGHVCKADNSTHTVYVGYLGPKMHTATVNTLNGSWDTTDLTVVYDSQPVLSGGSETDVVYQYANLDPGLLGRAYCDDDDVGSQCDQFYVLYDGDELCPGTDCNDTSFHQAIACHETGHTVGLLHGNNATPYQTQQNIDLRCMRTNPQPDDPGVGSHNAAQVNANY